MDPYVNICICITPGSDITDDRIAKDLAVAESIWQPISFQIKDVIILNESFRFHDGEISYIDSIQIQPKVSSFFNTCSSQFQIVTFIFVILEAIILKSNP